MQTWLPPFSSQGNVGPQRDDPRDHETSLVGIKCGCIRSCCCTTDLGSHVLQTCKDFVCRTVPAFELGHFQRYFHARTGLSSWGCAIDLSSRRGKLVCKDLHNGRHVPVVPAKGTGTYVKTRKHTKRYSMTAKGIFCRASGNV